MIYYLNYVKLCKIFLWYIMMEYYLKRLFNQDVYYDFRLLFVYDELFDIRSKVCGIGLIR